MQLLWMVFLAGLAGGFGHCIGMCGGIVAACSFAGTAGKGKISSAPAFQALYHSGRLATYSLLGAAFGALGSLPAFSSATRPFQMWIPIVAGVLMVIVGIAIALGWDSKVMTMFGRGSNRFARSTAMFAKNGMFAALPFGLLMGFLPCGMLAAMELKAMSTGSALWGAAVMLSFGLGTVPGLSGFGIASGFLGTQVRGILLKMGAVIVVVIGLLTIARGFARLNGFGM